MPASARPPSPTLPGDVVWPCLSRGPAGELWLDVAVSPNARRTGVDGLHDGALRVRLVAPPVEGRANAALVDWLADELGLPRRAVQLLRGESSRRKRLLLQADEGDVRRWLEAHK
ncbi:MAG: DUF167 domain-containing protein [Rubrivivax sp.]|nr:DUF167 domain-containing protein [Rubrivivax sp.]